MDKKLNQNPFIPHSFSNKKMDYLRNRKPECLNHDATIKESELSEKAQQISIHASVNKCYSRGRNEGFVQ